MKRLQRNQGFRFLLVCCQLVFFLLGGCQQGTETYSETSSRWSKWYSPDGWSLSSLEDINRSLYTYAYDADSEVAIARFYSRTEFEQTYDQITVSIEHDAYPSDVEQIVFTVKNGNSGKAFSVWKHVVIEKADGDIWRVIRPLIRSMEQYLANENTYHWETVGFTTVATEEMRYYYEHPDLTYPVPSSYQLTWNKHGFYGEKRCLYSDFEPGQYRAGIAVGDKRF